MSPTTPVTLAGMRMEPPPSLPRAMGPSPAATAAPAPPLEPPGERSRSQGLRVTPHRGLSVMALWPSSEVVVLPMRIPPAARIRATLGASWGGVKSAKRWDPKVVLRSLVQIRSLTEKGTPSRGPRGAPLTILASAILASSRAASGLRVTKALTPRLQGLGPLQHLLHHLHRRDPPMAEQSGQLRGRGEHQVGLFHNRFLPGGYRACLGKSAFRILIL